MSFLLTEHARAANWHRETGACAAPGYALSKGFGLLLIDAAGVDLVADHRLPCDRMDRFLLLRFDAVRRDAIDWQSQGCAILTGLG